MTNEETKQLNKEIAELRESRMKLEQDQVTEVTKLRADYKSRGKRTINEAAEKIRPLAEKHREQAANLNRDYKVEQARIQKDVEEQIAALKRSMQSRLAKAKNDADNKRDAMTIAHKSETDAVEKWMYSRQEDLELESEVGVETMMKEYENRIAEIDAQLSVLEEAIEIEAADDKALKQKAREESNKRREARQASDIERRKRALGESIRKQGGPLKQPARRNGRKSSRKPQQARAQ